MEEYLQDGLEVVEQRSRSTWIQTMSGEVMCQVEEVRCWASEVDDTDTHRPQRLCTYSTHYSKGQAAKQGRAL